ncbi:MAG: alpha-mannosidase, partial [Clostridiales bacterium]|nr:alpha-mannosidase [Clostridiales bacterium]
IMERLLKEKLQRGADTLKRGIYRKINTLRLSYAVTREPVAFADRLRLAYVDIREGEVWSKNVWDCAWFHITGNVGKFGGGYLALDLEGEGCVYNSEGTPVRGVTNVSSEFDRALGLPGKRYIPLCELLPSGQTKLDIWVDAANNDLFGGVHSGVVKECAVVRCDENRRDVFYDYAFLLNLMESVPDTDPLHYTLAYALEKVAAMAAADMTEEKLAECRAVLRPHLERKNIADPLLTFYAVGHSHLDLAWKWPIRETRRKAVRTFSTAIANLKNYPDYVYGASQPQQFAWVKADSPALYENIKQAVKEGRFELQGGMWVEADTNVSGGEALVRQFLYGKKFWQEEFGKDTNVLWLPDVFGFSGALPQIMRGCGCENFLTIKLSWNMVNAFPHHSFKWQGIDGSEVLVHMPPEGTYNSSGSPKALRFAAGNYAQRGLSKNAMMLYGIGDGGGGPGREHLEYVRREKDVYGAPHVKCAPSGAFFAALQKERDNLPTYKGEIYLERHQGTYTSQSDNKYYNRKMENALADYEFAQAVTRNCDKAKTDGLWKETLLYQFHDILPGSSIKRVYDESVARYKQMYADTAESIRQTFATAGNTPCVYNATSFTRDEYVEDGGKWYRVKAMPYAVTELGKAVSKFGVYADAHTVGNALVEAKIADDGTILSVTDKKSGREALRAPSGAFAVYNDVGDGWDFYHGYKTGGTERFAVKEIKPFTEGARAGVAITYVYGNSLLTQTIGVTENSPLIRIDVTVDWQETEKMLRTDFYPNADTDEAICDIQWGSVARRMTENNSIETAQYEVCAHKWVDMSAQDYGVAVINDSKYGYRLKNGCVSMHLLRSQTSPCENQDKGEHRFSYAIYPHDGSTYRSDVAAVAYAFNRPLTVVRSSPRASAVRTDNPHAVIETVKPAEDGNGFIVRLYNDTPQPLRTQVSAMGTFTVTDMLENDREKTDGAIELKGFEIVTLRIT